MTPTSHARLALLLCLVAVGCGNSADDSDIPERFRSFAQAVEQDRIAQGAPGMAVAVVERGEVTFAHGFGRKDASQPDPVLPTTLFRIGSCTKMLTAIALLQTVQQGLVSLDAPVTTYVPAFHLPKTPDAVAGIQVRHLLTHTSGLFDYGESQAPATEQTDAALEQFLTGRFADIGYVASPPGAVWAYANPNYMLAGLIAEKALGTPYRTLMRDRVFAPLGMNRTFFLASEVLADGDYAVGANCQTAGELRCFAPELPAAIQPDSYDNPWGRPAGFAWSSVLDLAQVARFLVHGQADVLGPELGSAMTSAQASTRQADDLVSYGFGVHVLQGIGGSPGLPYRALKVVTHNGAIAGFGADITCLPTLDFCLVALASTNAAYLQKGLLVALQTLVELPAPSPLPDLAPKPERYPLYAGTYRDAFGVGVVTVAADGARLTINIPSFDADGTAYDPVLAPGSVDNFVITIEGQQRPLTFVADGTGQYKYLRSRPYVATRDGP